MTYLYCYLLLIDIDDIQVLLSTADRGIDDILVLLSTTDRGIDD